MPGSPPVSRRSSCRYRVPAWTLSRAEFGLSVRDASVWLIHAHVPGMICITPRAFALETAALLKPLSCQAMALASEAGTPSRIATWPICDAVTLPGVALGAAAGTIRVAGVEAGAPAATAHSVPL